MVKYNLDDIFASLSDPTRRDLLQRVAAKPTTISDLAEPYQMSLPAISKHIRILEHAQLVNREKDGRHYVISINPEPLKTAAQHIVFYRHFWTDKLDNLDQYLQKGGDT